VRAGLADRDVFEFLMRRGADIGLPDTKGEPLLHIAISRGHLGTVSRLIGYGAEVNQTDSKGRLPLDIAQSLGKGPNSTEILDILIRNGARATTRADIAPGQNQTLKTKGTQE